MKNISKINSTDIRITGNKKVFHSLENAFKKFGIDFYIIGAFARDIMFSLHNEQPVRATQDIDIGVMISREEVFNDLKEHLIKNENFKADKNEPYRMRCGNIMIDLLPFGEIENEDRTIKIHGKETFEMNVLGLKEVFDKSEIVEIENEFSFRITTLAGICILKLLAYNDKPESRVKDIEDVDQIISKYADMNVDYVCEKHSDIMENGWNENLSARVLGRDMGAIVKVSKELRNKIISILNDNIEGNRTGKIPELMAIRSDATEEGKIKVLEKLLHGIRENL